MKISERKPVHVIIGIIFFGWIALWGNHSAFSESLLPEDMVMAEEFEPGAGSPVGKIRLVQGEVIIFHTANLLRGYPAAQEIPLFKGDTIITREKSRARLELNDGSAMTLASETKLELNQIIYDPEKQNRSSFMKMVVGKTRFLVKKMSDFKRSDFKVKTQTAIVGVRGSDFIVVATGADTEVTALEQTDLEIISTIGLDEMPVIVNDFKRSRVEAGKLPSEPVEVFLEEIEKIKQDFIIEPDSVELMTDKEPDIFKASEGIRILNDDIVSPEDMIQAEMTPPSFNIPESNHPRAYMLPPSELPGGVDNPIRKEPLPSFPGSPE